MQERKKADRLHILGTASGVGKSLITTAICRIFLQDGYRPCPFKAQNMALNSFVTRKGEEIGRSQAVQALACRLEPTADMNPILIKPMAGRHAQIIVRGRPLDTWTVEAYGTFRKEAQKIVLQSFARLADQYDIVVLEGAGSPVEPNLKARDIVNIRLAQRLKAPVILVGDIDRGGVFAWFIGTLQLMTEKERERVRGLIINKFRGEKRSLQPAVRDLEKRTGKKVLGIIPYFQDIHIPEEDSVFLGTGGNGNIQRKREDGIEIAIIRLPHISNFTDFEALEREPDVSLRYVNSVKELGRPDVIILPGTKSTVHDLFYLRKSGLASKIVKALDENPRLRLIGICGGFQMLGKKITDPGRTESEIPETVGLGLLPMVTDFQKEKILAQVKGVDLVTHLPVLGYEIHHGLTRHLEPCRPVFLLTERKGRRVKETDGVSCLDGRVWGTYLHGVFDADAFRREFLNRIRKDKGLAPLPVTAFDTDRELEKLADRVRAHLDMDAVYEILGGLR